MMTTLARLIRCRSAATAAEFAMTVPLLLILLFAVIDGGRYVWTANRAEKATQFGVRYAAATELVPEGLETYSFVVSGGLGQGDPIPQSAFGGAICTNTTCTCQLGQTCPPLGTYRAATFTNIVTRMQAVMPEIQPDNVIVEYNYSGLGYAGDPHGPDVAPLVVVSLQNMQFQPSTFVVFGGTLNLPSFRAALTLEDGVGTLSN